MERCLACRARLSQHTVCPRCGCDFSLALEAAAAARRHLQRTLQALAQGDRPAAAQALHAAQALQRTALAPYLAQCLQ